MDIYNKSSSEIHNLVLEYTGGKKIIKTLLPQENFKQKINPTGESTLAINFYSDGKSYRQDLDIYMENDYSGYIIINISEDGKVDSEDHITLPKIFGIF